jgi:hypothetical protein
VAIAGCELGPQASRGAVADIEWQLDYEAGPARIDPAPGPLKVLRPMDMQLLSRPQARFQGSVRVGEQLFAISDAAGMLCHYRGARLPERWCWISASKLGGEDGAVEAMLLRSRLWGLPYPRLDTGYCFVTQGDRTRMLISPLNALMRLQGSWHEFRLHARPLTGRERIRLDCSAAPEQYNDLGEGFARPCSGPAAWTGPPGCQDRPDLKSEATDAARGQHLTGAAGSLVQPLDSLGWPLRCRSSAVRWAPGGAPSAFLRSLAFTSHAVPNARTETTSPT